MAFGTVTCCIGCRALAAQQEEENSRRRRHTENEGNASALEDALSLFCRIAVDSYAILRGGAMETQQLEAPPNIVLLSSSHSKNSYCMM